jgi:hypothetical protein
MALNRLHTLVQRAINTRRRRMAHTPVRQRKYRKNARQRQGGVQLQARRGSHNGFTKFGGSAALCGYLSHVLQFRERFASVTVKKGTNSQFTTVDMLLGLLGLIMLGCDRVYHINDQFGEDVLLAKQLGLVRIFDQSTANRFLRQFKKWHTNQLERILRGMVWAHGGCVRVVCRILDIDASDLTRMTHKSTGAKPGRNKRNKGKDSYLITCGFAGDQVVATDFRAGNAHCSQALTVVFEKAMTAMSRIDLIRLDAGYISIRTLTWLLAQKVSAASDEAISFLVGCNGQANGLKVAKAYARQHPERWTQVTAGSDDILVMNFSNVQLFSDYPDGVVRLVLVKMKQQVKTCKQNTIRYHARTRIYGIATNLRQGYGARQIFKKYQQRQTIELMFRELKNSFPVGKLPSNHYYADYGWFLLCCLAYNAGYYFKRDVVPVGYKRCSMATVRRRFLEVPALRTDVWEVEFNRDYRYFREYLAMSHAVQRLSDTGT